MSANKEAYPGIVETFVRPDMPVTLWRCVWGVLFWLTYCAGCVLSGYYASSWGTQASRSDTAASHYHLSDAHYVYKKRPLPEPEEAAAEAVYEESVDEQPTTSEESDVNADLRARVKQAMADIDHE